MTEIEAVRWRLEWAPGPTLDAYTLLGLDSRALVTFREYIERRHIRRAPTLHNGIQALVTGADLMLERHV
jgi:hypothetical protein